jgi:hypothetical protein
MRICRFGEDNLIPADLFDFHSQKGPLYILETGHTAHSQKRPRAVADDTGGSTESNHALL